MKKKSILVSFDNAVTAFDIPNEGDTTEGENEGMKLCTYNFFMVIIIRWDFLKKSLNI
jgi:hypothetical protein